MKRRGSSRFLVRPLPIQGESLSSWRQRSGWANGYFLFPLLDQRQRRTDPDREVCMDDALWLAGSHDISVNDVLGMTLNGPLKLKIAPDGWNLHPPWWIQARFASNARQYGGMFCPQCLGHDTIPHFRLIWRLGFVTHCPTHKCHLLDCCPACGAAPWPKGAGFQEPARAFESLRQCWRCGHDLASAKSLEVTHKGLWPEWFEHPMRRFGNQVVPIHEALMALRAICQLFIKNRSRAMILGSNSKWSELAKKVSAEGVASQSIEQCNIEDRSLIVPEAIALTIDWPNNFLAFARASSISRVHFSGAYHLVPIWMLNVIDKELARQNRWVTYEMIDLAYKELAIELGRQPFKAEVRRRLGWNGDLN